MGIEFEQLTIFDYAAAIVEIGQKIEYISCGKKYKGTVKGYLYGGKYIACTTNQKGFSGVSLHIENKGGNWFVN